MKQVYDERAYEAELSALQTIHHFKHPHIVNAIASYTTGEANYLIFPWAEGNLRQYWDRHSDNNYRSGYDVMRWTLQQSVGLASGIESLHNKGTRYGRHGDLKPENILWFPDFDKDGNGLGTLKISDFGLTRFHSTRDAHSRDVHKYGTAVYSPPEIQEIRRASQSMDIWSLGCIFLESLAWLASGREGLQALTVSRTSISPAILRNDLFKDAFFELSDHPRQSRGTLQLKSGVLKVSLQSCPKNGVSMLMTFKLPSSSMTFVYTMRHLPGSTMS